MKLKVIITGATGMVGEGILFECLQNEAVESVLVVGRKTCGKTHEKLKEIIHANFFDISAIESELQGYDACFFCLGVSSVGMKDEIYFKYTHTLTMGIATVLSKLNPQMTFCYVSGAGTDSTEKKGSMWARVKGKTENDILKLPFKRAYAFRPGYIQPIDGLENTLSYYKYMDWLYPALRFVFPGFVCTLQEIGKAMIQCAQTGYTKPVLEVQDIVQLAKKG